MNMVDDCKKSKLISKVLRHKPELANVVLDEYGWANVDDLIVGISKIMSFDKHDLEKIVENDEKHRYSFNEDKSKIKANYGHSVPVELEMDSECPPEFLYHGTADKYVDSINANGLISKSRNYVHLSEELETALKVGSRHGKPVVYCVKAKEMYDYGFEFFKTESGIWLTKHVPVKYLTEVNIKELK